VPFSLLGPGRWSHLLRITAIPTALSLTIDGIVLNTMAQTHGVTTPYRDLRFWILDLRLKPDCGTAGLVSRLQAVGDGWKVFRVNAGHQTTFEIESENDESTGYS
jgi:hypothetical protein